ncbi:hypothetical protein STEG23_033675, partial [Scotinomys teguina]
GPQFNSQQPQGSSKPSIIAELEDGLYHSDVPYQVDGPLDPTQLKLEKWKPKICSMSHQDITGDANVEIFPTAKEQREVRKMRLFP